MQRSPEKTDGIAAAKVDHAALEQASNALVEVHNEIAAVNRYYGEAELFKFDRAVSRLGDVVRHETVYAIEAGVLLCLIKANAKDRFYEALEIAGVDDRFARSRMQLAIKLKDRPSLQKLGLSKALQLMSEDDDTLDALALGGTGASLTLDEIDRMSVRELKETLRKEREEYADEKAADEEIIRKKDERINKLSRRSTRSTRRDEINELLADLDRAKVNAAAELKTLMDSVGAIQTVYDEAKEQPEEDVQQAVESALEFANKWVHELADRLGE